MEANLRSLPPGDPKLIDSIVSHLKCEGIFDEFRKACLADVDTKPAYQNLRTRVEGFTDDYLKSTQWRPDLNKNQLRDGLRRHIQESGLLTSGVERIIDQIVNPKIVPFFLPKLVEIVCRILGIVEEETSVSSSLTEDIKTGFEPPTAMAGPLENLTTPEPLKSISNIQKKPDIKPATAGPSDAAKAILKSPVTGKSKIPPSQSAAKNTDGGKLQKTAEEKSNIKAPLSQDSVSPKMKSNESPKTSGECKSSSQSSNKSTDEKKTAKPIGKDESDKGKIDKSKTVDKNKQKTKLVEKQLRSNDSKGKPMEKQKSTENDKSKTKDAPSSKEKSSPSIKPNKTNERGENDRVSTSQYNKSSLSKDVKKESFKLRTDDRTQSPKSTKSKSKKADIKSGEKKGSTKEKSESSHREKTKRKHDDEGSQGAKRSKFEMPTDSASLSPSSEEKATKTDDKIDNSEMSDVTVSSVHTSDLSDFDDRISLSDVDDDESNSQKTNTKSPRKDKQNTEQNSETSEEKRAGLKISEDALMSSDELRITNLTGETEHSPFEPKRELRRQRKANPKYTSEDFSTIFSNNQDKHSAREHQVKEKPADLKLTSQHSDSTNKSDLLGSPISDTPSDHDEMSQSISTLHSPILSSDDDMSSNSKQSNPGERNSPKEEPKTSESKPRTRIESSPDDNTSSLQISQCSQDGVSRHPKRQRFDSRQRYDSSDLYKPRPVIGSSRRRTHATGSGDNSPARSSPRQTSSSENGSPGQFEHLPPSKRRRV